MIYLVLVTSKRTNMYSVIRIAWFHDVLWYYLGNVWCISFEFSLTAQRRLLVCRYTPCRVHRTWWMTTRGTGSTKSRRLGAESRRWRASSFFRVFRCTIFIVDSDIVRPVCSSVLTKQNKTQSGSIRALRGGDAQAFWRQLKMRPVNLLIIEKNIDRSSKMIEVLVCQCIFWTSNH